MPTTGVVSVAGGGPGERTRLTKRLSTDLPALGADFIPGAAVHLVGAVAKLAGQRDDFSDDELGDTARVGKRGVEDGDAMAGSIVEIDLVGTDAEAADDEQVLGFAQHLLGELRLRADADDVDIASRPNKRCQHHVRVLARARDRDETEGRGRFLTGSSRSAGPRGGTS